MLADAQSAGYSIRSLLIIINHQSPSPLTTVVLINISDHYRPSPLSATGLCCIAICLVANVRVIWSYTISVWMSKWSPNNDCVILQ